MTNYNLYNTRGESMLDIGVGETITDGFKTYVMGHDLNLHFVSYGNHATHHVSEDALKIVLKSQE